jgi:hypothetical protein
MDGHQRENTRSFMIELAIKGDQLTMLGDLPDSNIYLPTTNNYRHDTSPTLIQIQA